MKQHILREDFVPGDHILMPHTCSLVENVTDGKTEVLCVVLEILDIHISMADITKH